MNRLRKRKRKL